MTSIGWDFNDDGQYQESSQPVAQWSFSVGDHRVRFRVIDNEGAETVATKTLHIVVPPPPRHHHRRRRHRRPRRLPSADPDDGGQQLACVPAGIHKGQHPLREQPARRHDRARHVQDQAEEAAEEGLPVQEEDRHDGCAAGQVQLAQAFPQEEAAPGTKITIVVTVPGQIGKQFRYTIRKSAAPKKQILCIPPGGKPARCV